MRTESQKTAMSPIKVMLGEKEYSIPLLKTLKGWEWRDKLMQQMTGVLGGFSVSVEGPQIGARFNDGLIAALTKFPRKLAEMVFEYAPSLPKDEILNDATEEQLLQAFASIMEVAMDPILGPLKLVTDVMKSELASSLSPASTN